MLLCISIAVILLGVAVSLLVTWAKRKFPKLENSCEGAYAVGYSLSAFGAVALYGVLSGQIVLPA
ncbi:MAG: hypothetical protein ACI4K9_05540 [Candidatus Fimenecus sp.]